MRLRHSVTTLVVALTGFGAWPARAAGPLGPPGSDIQTSNYRVDLSQGVVLASARVMGLAGAYVAIAEGVDGNSQNPAAPAVRLPYSFDDFDYDWGIGVTLPSSIGNNDYFNTGDRRTAIRSDQSGFLFVNGAVNLMFGEWGVGLSIDYQRYKLTRTDALNAGVQSDELFARFGGARLQVARAVFDNQLVLGLGSRGTGLAIENDNPAPGQPGELFATQGAALEAGLLWKPNWQPFRVGFAARSPVFTNDTQSAVAPDASGDRVLGTGPADPNALWLPNQVALPGELTAGFAVQVGPRPLNPRWANPEHALRRVDRYLRWRELERERRRVRMENDAIKAGSSREAASSAAEIQLRDEAVRDELHRERVALRVRQNLAARYDALKRFYVLVTTSVSVSGRVDDAVGVESFLQRKVARSGERLTVSPRLGVESEVVPHWLKLRAGTYGEPSRFADGSPRLHGTLGFDLKLFPWTVFGVFDEGTHWRATAAMDAAPRYFGWSVSVGIWH